MGERENGRKEVSVKGAVEPHVDLFGVSLFLKTPPTPVPAPMSFIPPQNPGLPPTNLCTLDLHTRSGEACSLASAEPPVFYAAVVGVK